MIADSNDEATNTNTATTSTEMYIAAEKDDWQAVVLHLKTHAQEAYIFNDEHSVAPLHQAALSHDVPIEVLEQLIDIYPEALTTLSGYDKSSPFCLAIEKGVAMPKNQTYVRAWPKCIENGMLDGLINSYNLVSWFSSEGCKHRRMERMESYDGICS
jgi:hypothetical protein